MNKKIIIILSGLMLATSGCGQYKPNGFISTNTSTPPISTTSSTTNTPPLAINKNDVATWPRFEFKELGFSVQLPFEKSDIKTEYDECRGGKFYSKNNDTTTFSLGTNDACIDPRSNFSYYQVKIKKGNYVALSSVVGYSPIEGEGGILTDNKGNPIFKEIGKPFTKINSPTGTAYVLNDPNYEQNQIIHPLKITYIQGTELVTFNYLDEVARHNHFIDYTPEELAHVPYRVTIFNLPENKIFKTVSLQFTDNDVNQDQLIKLLNTIKFHN